MYFQRGALLNMATDSLSTLENRIFGIGDGKLVISPDNMEKSASIIVSNDEIIINSSNISSGIAIDDSGVLIQGNTVFTGYGTSIKKGEYSENPNSAKMFTYPDTLYFESVAKETIYVAAGKTAGLNLSKYGGDGLAPLFTDVATPITGGPGHIHTISFKHVHRIEPTYLYRIPAYVKIFKNFMSGFIGFLSS